MLLHLLWLLAIETTLLVFADGSRASVPLLSDMCSDWTATSQYLDFPTISNFWGSLSSSPNVLAINSLLITPYAQGTETAILRINGTSIDTQSLMWCPYDSARRGTDKAKTISVESHVRMAFEGDFVMFQLVITNQLGSTTQNVVDVELNALIRAYNEFPWGGPFPKPGEYSQFAYSTTQVQNEPVLLVQDTNSATWVAFGFVGPQPNLAIQSVNNYKVGHASWNLQLSPKASTTLKFVLQIAPKKDQVLNNLQTATKNYDLILRIHSTVE